MNYNEIYNLCKNFILYLFKHSHKWQIRGRNKYGGETYRICLKCRETYQRVNNPWENERWEQCEPILNLDAQFDKNDNYIFKL